MQVNKSVEKQVYLSEGTRGSSHASEQIRREAGKQSVVEP